MGRPQFGMRVERPTDAQVRTDGHEFIKSPDNTVSTGFETTVDIDIADNEPRVLESVSIRPEPMETVTRVGVIAVDDEGNPFRWAYAQYPEGVPLQFDPGIRIPEGNLSQVTITLRQETGSDVNYDVYVGHRGVE